MTWQQQQPFSPCFSLTLFKNFTRVGLDCNFQDRERSVEGQVTIRGKTLSFDVAETSLISANDGFAMTGRHLHLIFLCWAALASRLRSTRLLQGRWHSGSDTLG